MSLFSYLTNDNYGSSTTAGQISLAIQQAQAKMVTTQAATATPSTTGTGDTAAYITVEAKRAAAAKADAGKDAAVLAAEVRASLNADYATAGQRDAADLRAMSGRALAIVALDTSGTFSKTKIAAAKLELRGRDRQALLSQIASGPLTAASLAAFQKDSLDARASMSAEELQLREINPRLR